MGSKRCNMIKFLFFRTVLGMCLQLVQCQDSVVPAVYVFGDSSADVGNNNYRSTYAKCNFQPYGRQWINGLATGRCSNGRLVVDFLAEDLRLGGYPSAFYAEISDDVVGPGINFASATDMADTNGPHHGQVVTLAAQVTLFQEETVPAIIRHFNGNRGQAMEHIGASIFYMSHGMDRWLQNFFVNDDRHPTDAYASTLHTQMDHALRTLYNQGARRFVVMELPALGCTPYVMQAYESPNGACIETYNHAVHADFNIGLENILHEFRRDTSARILVARSFNATRRAARHLGDYGFTANGACCGTGDYNGRAPCSISNVCSDATAYPWWDGYHMSERLADVIEREITVGNSRYNALRWTYDNLREFLNNIHD